MKTLVLRNKIAYCIFFKKDIGHDDALKHAFKELVLAEKVLLIVRGLLYS